MPGEDSKFNTAVKESLEALLTDLQNTTAVLKRANLSEKYTPTNVQMEESEPIYQAQKAKRPVESARPASTGLEDLQQMLEDYDDKRTSTKQDTADRPTVESLLTELDDAVVQNGSNAKPSEPSSASKELDDLMGSLSNFKMQQHQQQRTPDSSLTRSAARSPRGLVPEQDQLDSMLGTLQSDMSKHGISTIPKGDCAACNKTIVGQVVIALGKMWHPEHFLCCHCAEELGHRNFFERGGKAYCESDYHNLFSPRCAYCNGPIKDKCITALEKTWHPDHFFCAQCGKDFGEDGFHEKDTKAFCRQCYFASFAPHCKGCGRSITNNYITALNTQWHPECFVCQDCKQPFAGGSYFEHEGRPFCETHYHEKRGTLCFSCDKPISGRCVTAMQRKFHPEHFVCSFCRRELNKGTFKEHENKPYCHKCFTKLLN